jgi:regulator of sigma E protease
MNDLPKDLILNEKVTLRVNRNGADTLISLPPGFLSTLTKNQLGGFVSPRFPVVVDSLSAKIEIKSGTLQKGDQLVAINNEPFIYFNEFEDLKPKYKNQVVPLKVLRSNDTATVNVKVQQDGSIGFYPKSPDKFFGIEYVKYSFAEAIPAGVTYGMNRLQDYMRGIGLLFTSKEHKVADNLGSVISIGKTFGGTWDWQRFWLMTALFSIILAFMNILPIPALDGGHALFTIYEMITGRKPSDKFMEYAQMVGMILLLGLMAYAFGLDIWRLFK